MQIADIYLGLPNKLTKAQILGKKCFFPEKFMNACHISILHFYHMRILTFFDKNGSDLLLCIDAQIKECRYEGNRCPENSPKQTDD